MLRSGLCFSVDCIRCHTIMLGKRSSSISCATVDCNTAEKNELLYPGRYCAACELHGTFNIDGKVQILLTLLSVLGTVRTRCKMHNCLHPVKGGLPIGRWPQFEARYNVCG